MVDWKNMGSQAVGAYLRGLIAIQRLTDREIAEKANIQQKYLWRLETGVIKEPSANLLRKLTMLLRGSWEDVGLLLDDVEATVSDGHTRAVAWAAQSGLLDPGLAVERLAPEELEQAAALLLARATELRNRT